MAHPTESSRGLTNLQNRKTVLALDGVHHWAAESISVFEVIMLAYLFVLLAVAVRLFGALTRQYALTAVGASLLYFGAKGPRKQWWIAVGILAATDLALTLFVYHYVLYRGSPHEHPVVRRSNLVRHIAAQ